MSDLLGARSPPGAALLTAGLPAAPVSACDARRAVRAVLDGRVDADVLDTVLLLTTELVSNAATWASTAVGLRVTLSTAGVLRVEVADSSPAAPTVTHAPHDAERGRGLLLVSQLADAWGARPTPPRGKVVWFVLRT